VFNAHKANRINKYLHYMNKTIILILSIFVLLFGSIIYFSTNRAKNSLPVAAYMPPVITQDSQVASSNNQSSTKKFVVDGNNYSFSPNTFQVTMGDTVNITFKNIEGTHDLVLDEFAVRTKILKSGEEETIQFVADKIGKFEFYCSIGTHRKMGMKGTLEVM